VNYTKSGEPYHMEWSIHALHDEAGKLRHYVAVQRDITARKQYELQIEEQARLLAEANQQLAEANARLNALSLTDSLTGIANHRAFHQKLNEEVARANRYRTPLSLLLLDVDWFKGYNDTFGHPAGDEALQKIARVLQHHRRASDLVARHGGEEFAVLLPQTDRAGAQALAEELCAGVASDKWPLRAVTISIGAATLDEFSTNPSFVATAIDIVKCADEALYRSKHEGRNRREFLRRCKRSELDLLGESVSETWSVHVGIWLAVSLWEVKVRPRTRQAMSLCEHSRYFRADSHKKSTLGVSTTVPRSPQRFARCRRTIFHRAKPSVATTRLGDN
jgi:diguanylate cyclase (GGDEF)-like protein